MLIQSFSRPRPTLLKMVFVPFFYLLAGLTLASGKPILLPRLAQEASQDVAEHSFDVTLESLGNSTVKAEVTNTGTEGLRLVQRGGILDQFPTRKVNVKGGGKYLDACVENS